MTATPFASFPWYDLPEMHAANDALWAALAGSLAAQGIPALPERLDRERAHGVDPDGECLFTQTCGYPLFTTARGHFTVLAAPCYDVPGCAGLLHRSYIVVRDDAAHQAPEDLRGARFAINESDSNSGMNLPRRFFAPLSRDGRFFTEVVVSGSHAASAGLVADRAVDAAAIDCVTFAMLRRHRPDAVGPLRVIGTTAPTPAPPLVTSQTSGEGLVRALRSALVHVARDPALHELRAELFLADVDVCDASAYDVVMRYEREAHGMGYAQLA